MTKMMRTRLAEVSFEPIYGGHTRHWYPLVGFDFDHDGTQPVALWTDSKGTTYRTPIDKTVRFR